MSCTCITVLRNVLSLFPYPHCMGTKSCPNTRSATGIVSVRNASSSISSKQGACVIWCRLQVGGCLHSSLLVMWAIQGVFRALRCKLAPQILDASCVVRVHISVPWKSILSTVALNTLILVLWLHPDFPTLHSYVVCYFVCTCTPYGSKVLVGWHYPAAKAPEISY